MLELLFADQSFPFTLALVLMLLIAVVEIAAIAIGGGLSGALETLLPDLPSGDEAGSSLAALLGWLRFKQVPVLMLLVIFLTGFGLSGLFIQSTVHGLFGFYLPSLLVAVPASFSALPVVRLFGGWLHRYLPGDETSVVSEQSFIGRVAVITLGTARQGHPAEAKLRDEHGQSHYLMVEPDQQEEPFPQGTHVVLTERLGSVYRAIRNYNPNLTDQ